MLEAGIVYGAEKQWGEGASTLDSGSAFVGGVQRQRQHQPLEGDMVCLAVERTEDVLAPDCQSAEARSVVRVRFSRRLCRHTG